MKTKEAFFEMAKKHDMVESLTEAASIDPVCKKTILEWFSASVLMANTRRRDAFVELLRDQARGVKGKWTIDSVCAVEISDEEIDSIHENFIEIVKNFQF